MAYDTDVDAMMGRRVAAQQLNESDLFGLNTRTGEVSHFSNAKINYVIKVT